MKKEKNAVERRRESGEGGEKTEELESKRPRGKKVTCISVSN